MSGAPLACSCLCRAVRFEVAPPLWSRDPGSGDVFSVRMGAFDNAAAWEPIPDDGLERFGGSAWPSAIPGTM